MSRIYDRPEHPCYGPVRRLHLILMLITADKEDGMASLDKCYSEDGVRATWDADLAWFITAAEYAEAVAHRIVLKRCLRAIP